MSKNHIKIIGFTPICFFCALTLEILLFQANPIMTYESLLFDKPNPELNTLFAEAFLYLKRAVEKWPGDNEVLLEKLQGIYSTWYEKGQAAYKGFGDFGVLSHGDFHFKNVMYKYNGDKFEDLLLVNPLKSRSKR
jgi:Ecdysteroid kinase-like family